jgi:hypothetical protein
MGYTETMIIRGATVMLIGLLAAVAQADVDEEDYTAAQVVAHLVESFGVDHWPEIEEIRFTFNVKKDETRAYRSWRWEPKTDRVRYTGPLGDEERVEVEYQRSALSEDSPEARHAVDAKFINDTFWLLLPLHLSWSADAQVEYTGYHLTPIGRNIARQVVVTYPQDGGGYTPGDVYRLYCDQAWRITQWSYHKAGAEEPTLATVWVQDEQVGPLALTTEFVNDDEKFRLWFADVAVRTTDSGDEWLEARRIKHACRTCR